MDQGLIPLGLLVFVLALLAWGVRADGWRTIRNRFFSTRSLIVWTVVGVILVILWVVLQGPPR